jgi:hypothetical protein
MQELQGRGTGALWRSPRVRQCVPNQWKGPPVPHAPLTSCCRPQGLETPAPQPTPQLAGRYASRKAEPQQTVAAANRLPFHKRSLSLH